jgi:hypothetical protein
MMTRLRGWIKRLEREADVVTVELRCPECGAEFVAKGADPVLDYLVHEWDKGYDGETFRETPPDVLRIANHEHAPSLLVDKATGKPWVGEFFAGTVRMTDDVEDLSEQARASEASGEV